jgi:hypothetical protein
VTATTAFPPQRGSMPILQFCAPSQLQVDTSYQRTTDARESRALITRIAHEWDWRLYQPLIVARRADGNFYVVDGQHRLEAARTRGDIVQLPCVITSYDTAQDEATAFVAINQQRKPLTKMNLHKAAVAAGDTDAVAINSLIERAGLRLTGWADANAWKPGWINNISGIAKCHRQHGERVTRLALEALAQGFEGKILRNCGSLFTAIYPVIAAQGSDYVPFIMLEILRDADQEGWLARFRAAATERSCGVAFAAKQLLTEAYAEATAE